MKYLITILFLATCSVAQAQTTVLTTDPSLPIPKLSYDEKGDSKITASATSSSSDFDFLVGNGKSTIAGSTKGSKTARIGPSSKDSRCGSLIRKPGCGFAGMRETGIARCGARRFLPTTEKPGNGMV
jgi:hypothetical protein